MVLVWRDLKLEGFDVYVQIHRIRRLFTNPAMNPRPETSNTMLAGSGISFCAASELAKIDALKRYSVPNCRVNNSDSCLSKSITAELLGGRTLNLFLKVKSWTSEKSEAFLT